MVVSTAGQNEAPGALRPRAAARLVTQSNENTGLPSIQSRGISLIWKNRSQNVLDRQTKTPQTNVHAEDLIYGYAPDVSFKRPGEDAWTPWLSLTDRTESFERDPALSPSVTPPVHGRPGRGTDGPLRLTATRTVDGTDSQQAVPSTDLHVGSILFRWDGWNLSTAETASVAGNDEDAVTLPDNNGDKRIKVPEANWSLKPRVGHVKQSLPPLRYGWSYKFRVRLMDITGAAPNLSSDEPSNSASDETKYLRYEPVPVPELLLDSPPNHHFLRGRQLHRLVITKDKPVDIRWMVPPRANLRLVQRHGMLDGIKRPRGFNGIEFDKAGDFPRVPLVDNDGKVPPSNGNDPQETAPIRRHSGEPPRKPYFPDPLAHGIAWAADIPGATSAPLTNHDANEADKTRGASFYADSEWPDAQPWKLILKATEKSQPYQTCDAEDRTLILHLPPGFSGTLKLGSSLSKDASDVTGFSKLGSVYIDKNLDKNRPHITSGERSQLHDHFQRTITAGALPFVTPQITLDLIYAVPQPREAPVIDYFAYLRQPWSPPDTNGEDKVVEREVGKPIAHLYIGVVIDIQTTGKLIFKASWDFPVDDPLAPRSAGSAVLGEQRIDLASADSVPSAYDFCELTHNLPGSGYFLVAYTAAALTRFIEQFPKQTVDESSKVSAPRYVEVLNCNRPKPVTFLRPLPVYDWQFKIDDKHRLPVFSNQRTGGVRFYLSRPWFLTGEDEVVGIVISYEDENLPDFVSCWGADIARKNDFSPVARLDDAIEGYVAFLPGEILDVDRLVKVLLNNSYEVTKNFTGELWSKLQNYPEGKNARAGMRSLLAPEFDRWIKAAGPTAAAKAGRRSALDVDENISKCLAPSRLFSTDNWASVWVEELQKHLIVVPFRPHFDEEQDAWYIEVMLHPGILPEYAFVRLALARYQPHSIVGAGSGPDLRLSKPFAVDYAQLSPGRIVSMWRDSADKDQVCIQVVSTEAASAAKVIVSLWEASEDGTGLTLETVLADLLHDPQRKATTGSKILFFGRIDRDFFSDPKKLLVREDALGEQPSSTDHEQAKRDLLQKITSAGNPPYLDILDI